MGKTCANSFWTVSEAVGKIEGWAWMIKRDNEQLELSFLRKQESSVFLFMEKEKSKTLDSRLRMSGMTERNKKDTGVPIKNVGNDRRRKQG